jgi:hypothetical protein
MPQSIFHVITEYPKIKHIPAKVSPPAVHEHGCEECQKFKSGIGKEAAGNECPLSDKRIAPA